MNSYLKSIRIKNHKSHKDTILELHPNVNVVYGRPQSGKSNILRAITLLKNNRPLGTKFMSNFVEDEGTVEIEVVTSEDDKVAYRKKIRKTKKGDRVARTHEYQLNDAKPYTGFGTSVPDKITQALNLGDMNIQKQLDQPYLITSSGGEFTRTVNRITNLDVANEWTQDLTKDINSLNKKAGIKKETLKTTIEDLKRFDDLDDLEEKISKLVGYEADKTITEFKIKKIGDLSYRFGETKCEIDNITNIVNTIEEKINALSYMVKTISEKTKMVGLLDTLNKTKEIIKNEDKINKLSKTIEIVLSANKKITLLNAIHKINNILINEQHLENMKDLLIEFSSKTKLIQFLEIIDTTNKHIIDIHNKIKKAVSEYIKELRKEKECPTCLSDIDDSVINKIEKELLNESRTMAIKSETKTPLRG